jgi:hypothetical protein
MNENQQETDVEEPEERRTDGGVANLAPVQIALVLLVGFLGLLVLWILWPVISGG